MSQGAPLLVEFCRVLGGRTPTGALESLINRNTALLHTQEVTGSSPVAPTIYLSRRQERSLSRLNLSRKPMRDWFCTLW